MGCFLPKYIVSELRKYSATKFDGTQDLYRGRRKKMTWGIRQFFTRPVSLKNGTLMTSFRVRLKIYRDDVCHENEKWFEIWWGIDLSVQNWHEEFDEFWPEHLKISKIYTLMDCFWAKYIIFKLRKYRGLCLMALKIDTNFEENLTCASKNDMRNLAIFHQSSKSQNWDFDNILLCKVENVWA